MLSNAAHPYTIDIKPDASQFTITVPANPTTGFLWTVTKYEKNIFQQSHSSYIAPNTKRIGAGGKMVFTFTCRKGKKLPHSTRVLLRYARPWDKTTASVTKIVVNFHSVKQMK
jgi:inhibitor of cysteine peptidase